MDSDSSVSVIGVVFFAFLALVVLALVFSSWRRFWGRGSALEQLAQELGWRYVYTDSSLHTQYAHRLFTRGHDSEGVDLMCGVVEVGDLRFDTVMGDYHYERGSGNEREEHEQSIILLTLPYHPVPALVIRRERLRDKLQRTVGSDDIDFESEEFNRRFYVSSNNKRFASAVIHPRMIDFLLQTSPPRIDLCDGACLLYEPDTLWSPDEFRMHLAWAHQFLDLWPVQLLAELQLLRHPERIAT